MSKPALQRTLTELASEDQMAYKYTRMACIINQVPAQGVSYRCGNLFGGGELPHTLYLLLVNQQAFSGSLNYLGNYFESGHVKSLQVFENGRPVLTQPVKTTYVYKDDGYTLNPLLSDATQPFLTMTQAMDGIADSQITAGVTYTEFLQGCIVTCVQLNSCGGTRTSPGFLDVELTLENDAGREPMLLLAFGEFDRWLRFDKNLRLLSH